MNRIVERVVEEDAPEEHYRNKFLATAMFNLKMVDTAGGGIKKMFNYQKSRFLPLPEYDLSGGKVKATIIGKVLDMEYARLLARTPNLSLSDIIMFDKVQKQKKLTIGEEKYLKSKGFIEGRKPNFYISKKIAQNIGQKAEYSKNKGFDKQWYLDLIKKSIQEHKQLNRSDVDNLLWNKLPDYMTEQQKKIKINNLLSELRRKEAIKNLGTFHNPKWVLINQ